MIRILTAIGLALAAGATVATVLALVAWLTVRLADLRLYRHVDVVAEAGLLAELLVPEPGADALAEVDAELDDFYRRCEDLYLAP